LTLSRAGIGEIRAVDDIPVARVTVPLTTIAFDLGEAGRRLAGAVAASLAGEAPRPTALSSRPHVIQRSST
jgi:DNA-binding LacI/PurR family transcriptional regulator